MRLKHCQVLKTAEITLFQLYIYHLLTVFFLIWHVADISEKILDLDI